MATRSNSRVFRVHDLPGYQDMREALDSFHWYDPRIPWRRSYNSVLDVVADPMISGRLFVGYKDPNSIGNFDEHPNGIVMNPPNRLNGFLRPDTQIYVRAFSVYSDGASSTYNTGSVDLGVIKVPLSALQNDWYYNWGGSTLGTGAPELDPNEDDPNVQRMGTDSMPGGLLALALDLDYWGDVLQNPPGTGGSTNYSAWDMSWKVTIGDQGHTLYAVQPDTFESYFDVSDMDTPSAAHYFRKAVYTDEGYVYGALQFDEAYTNMPPLPGPEGIWIEAEAGEVWNTQRGPNEGDDQDYEFHHEDVFRLSRIPLFPVSQQTWLQNGGDPNIDRWDGDLTKNFDKFVAIAYVAPEELSGADPSSIYVPTNFEMDVKLTAFAESIDSASATENGTLAGPITIGVDGGGQQIAPFPLADKGEGIITPYDLSIQAQFDQSSHRFFGVEVTTTEELLFSPQDPPVDESPDGTVQPGWLEPSKIYRADIASPYGLKHPMMPPGLGGAVAYDRFGVEVTIQRRGDYLVLVNASGAGLASRGPYTVYWNPVPDGPVKPTASANTVQSVSDKLSSFMWSAFERRTYLRSQVEPTITVLAGSDLSDDADTVMLQDVSRFLTEASSGDITLFGHGSIFSMDTLDDNFPRLVRIIVDGQTVYTGHLVRAQSESYANGNRLTLSTLLFSEFHDVDLASVETESMSFPALEEEYLRAILDRIGFHQSVVTANTTPPIEFRNTDFWTAAPPDGPGLAFEEVQDLYRNGSAQGSGMEEVRQVLNANMLDVHDLPNGDLFVAPILPFYNEDIQTIFENRTVKYGVDQDGNFVREPRLDVQEVRLDLDDNFSAIEVEGTSNEVSVTLDVGEASFWQAEQGETKKFRLASIPGMIAPIYIDSSDVWPSVDDPPGQPAYEATLDGDGHETDDTPWTFREHDGDGLALKVYPAAWYDEVKLLMNNDTIAHEKVSGGNRWITSVRLLKNPLSDFIREVDDGQGGTITWGEEFVNTFGDSVSTENYPSGVTLAQDAAWGIHAAATGTFWSSATFKFTVKVPEIDSSLISVKPLIGKYSEDFAPAWFPASEITERINSMELSKPRKARRVQNPYITPIGSTYAVQKHGVNDAAYDEDKEYAAHQLASWLTIKEFLKSRATTVRFAGAQPWWPGQFIAVARRPPGGEGSPVDRYDILMITSSPEVDAQVGSEVWTTAQAAYICSYQSDPGSNILIRDYDMLSAWSPTYQSYE